MLIKTSDQPEVELGFWGYRCNWGCHLAGLYESEQERDEIILGFLAQGARDRDIGLFTLAEQSVDQGCSSIAEASEWFDEPELLTVRPARDFYYPEGTFSPWTMDDSLESFFVHSQRNGPRNVRASAEMGWALEAVDGVEHLMAYESRLNYFIPGKPWISICLYNVNKFSGQTVMNVLRTHPFTVSGGVITENSYYEDPDVYLAKHAPQFLPPGHG